MPKFTRTFIQKVSEKYNNYGEEFFGSIKPIYNFTAAHPDFRYDENFDNNEDMVEFAALACAAYKADQSTYGLIVIIELKLGFPEDVQNNLKKLMEMRDEMDEILRIDNGMEVMMPSEEITFPEKKFTVNEFFDQSTLQEAKNNMINGYGGNLMKYEENPKNDMSVGSAINFKLQQLLTSPMTDETVDNHRQESAELLSIYGALQKRSEKRTFLDVLKHPFKTFGEWLAKGKVKSTLQSRYGLNDSQLESLTDIVKNKEIPDTYMGIDENGMILDSRQAGKNNRNLEDPIASVNGNILNNNSPEANDEGMDYDQLSSDCSFSEDGDAVSEFHNENERSAQKNISLSDDE